MEITGNWLSADQQAVLFIDIEGVDPCAQGTFSCTGLTGGGEGLERDAQGTFTLAP
jgi:hypothetical protein